MRRRRPGARYHALQFNADLVGTNWLRSVSQEVDKEGWYHASIFLKTLVPSSKHLFCFGELNESFFIYDADYGKVCYQSSSQLQI